MRRVLALVGGVCVVGIIVWMLASQSEPRRAPPAEPSRQLPSSNSIAGVAAESASDSRERIRPRVVVDSQPADAAAETEAAAVVRGRCIQPDRSPLAAVTAQLSGNPRTRESLDAWVARHGKLEWKNPDHSVTDADGRFEIRFAPPPPYLFVLVLQAPQRVMTMVRWFEVAAGAVLDLGDVVIVEGVALSGRTSDANGAPQPGVVIRLTSEQPRLSSGVVSRRSSFEVKSDDAGAFFCPDRVPPGRLRIAVDAPFELLSPASVEVDVEERERRLDLQVRGVAVGDVVSGIVVDDAGDPVARADINYDPMGGGIHRMVETAKDGTFTIQRSPEDPAKPIAVRAFRDGYEHGRSESRVAWGSKDVRIVMKRGVGVDLFVRDGDEGKPLEHYGVRCVPYGQSGPRTPDGARVKNFGEHPGGMMTLTELRRGTNLLIVEPKGTEWLPSAPHIFEVTDAGAPRQEVTVWRAIVKTIRVRTARKEPVQGTKVEVLRRISDRPIDEFTYVLPYDRVTMLNPRAALEIARGTTAADGTIELRLPPREPLVVRALGPGHAPMVQEIVSAPGPEAIDIVVARGATLSGVIGPAEILGQLGTDGPMSGVFVARQGKVDERYPLGHHPARIGDDGSFRIEAIPAGTWNVMLNYQESMGPTTSMTGHVAVARVTLADGEDRTETFDLSGFLKASIEGLLTLDGVPWGGAYVGFEGSRLNASGETEEFNTNQGVKTSEDGRFRATIWPGTYRLLIQDSPGGEHRSSHGAEVITVTAGQKVARTFDIQSSVLEIRVIATDGVTPAAGAKLTIKIPGSSWDGFGTADARGIAKLTGLPPGDVAALVYPKSLTTEEAMREFTRLGKRLGEVLVPAGTITITPPKTIATIVLPAAAGY